jgi:hypothetical protein
MHHMGRRLLKSCDFLDIMNQIKVKVADLGKSCPHDAVEELIILTHAKTRKKAKQYIKKDLCLSSLLLLTLQLPLLQLPLLQLSQRLLHLHHYAWVM